MMQKRTLIIRYLILYIDDEKYVLKYLLVFVILFI